MTRQTFEDLLTVFQANLLNRAGLWMVLVGGLAAFGLKGLGLRLDPADPSTIVLVYGLLIWGLGFYTLASTAFGWGTFKALRRTRKTIDRFQRLPASWQAKNSRNLLRVNPTALKPLRQELKPQSGRLRGNLMQDLILGLWVQSGRKAITILAVLL